MSRVTFSLALVFAVVVSAQVALAGDCKYSKAKKPKDIVDTAVSAGNFKTLAAALKAADLIKTLKSKGPFTVSAPTDRAFGILPKGTVEELLVYG